MDTRWNYKTCCERRISNFVPWLKPVFLLLEETQVKLVKRGNNCAAACDRIPVTTSKTVCVPVILSEILDQEG